MAFRFSLVLAAVGWLWAGELLATEYKWQGTVYKDWTKCDWTDPANWGGSGYPKGGDKASFPMAPAVPDCCGLKIEFTNTIEIASGTTLEIWGTSGSPMPAAKFSGGFTGAGKVSFTGGMTPTLTARSTNTGGMEFKDYQTATLTHCEALGTGPVSISGKSIYFNFGGGTIVNDFTTTRNSGKGANTSNVSLFNFQPTAARQTLAFTGTIRATGAFTIDFYNGCEGGQTVDFRGPLVQTDVANTNLFLFRSQRSTTPTVTDYNRVVLSGGVDAPRAVFGCDNAVNVVWNTPGETWEAPMPADLSVPSDPYASYWYSTWPRIRALTASNGTIRLTRAIGATGDGVSGYPLQFSCFNSGRIELAAGVTYASAKTVTLADTGSFLCDKLSQLDLFSSLAFATGTLFETREDAMIRDSELTVRKDGAALPGGYFTSDGRDNTQVLEEIGSHVILRSGGAYPTLTPVEAVWTGLGGDSALKTDGNWEGGAAPDFATGAAKPVFNAAATPSVTEDASVSGLRVTAGATAFSSADGSTLTVTPGASDIAAGASVSFAGPVAFSGNHSLVLGLGSTLSFAGALAGAVPGPIVFSCPTAVKSSYNPGRVTFAGPSTIRQDLVFTNVFVTAQGTNPFGDGYGKVTIRSMASFDNYAGCRNLILNGATVPNDVDLYHTDASFDRSLYVSANTTNRFDGLVSFANGKTRYVELLANSVTTFAGGVDYWQNNMNITSYGSGDARGLLVITNKPYVATGTPTFGNGAFVVRLAVSDNVLGSVNGNGIGDFRLTIAASNAVKSSSLTQFTKGVIDLGGYDTSFTACPSSAAAAVLTSANPAMIVFTGNATNTVSFTLAGKAGIGQSGKGKTTLGASQTGARGPFAASGSGALALAADVKVNASSVTLSGSGRLELAAGSGFTRRVDAFTASGSWKFSSSSDPVVVRYLTVDGVPQKSGTYTSAQFPDNIESGAITVKNGGFAAVLR